MKAQQVEKLGFILWQRRECLPQENKPLLARLVSSPLLGRSATWFGLLATALVLALVGCRPGVIWSPNSQHFLLQSRGRIYFFDLEKQKFWKLTSGPSKAFNPVWSPNGKQICYYLAEFQKDKIAGLSLVTHDLVTGKQRVVVPGVPFSSSGTTTGGGTAVPKGELQVEPRGDLLDLLLKAGCVVSWSPNGKEIAYMTQQGENDFLLYVVSATGGSPQRWISIPSSGALVWSPKGLQIVYYDQSGKLFLADANVRRPLWSPPAGMMPSMFNPFPQVAADGKNVGVFVETAPRGELKGEMISMAETCEAWVIPLEGGTAQKLVSVPGLAAFATFSADLKTVVFVTTPKTEKQAPEVVLLEAPYQQRQLFRLDVPGFKWELGEKAEIEAPAMLAPVLSPDGKWVALLLPFEKKPAQLFIGPTTGGQPRSFTVPVP